MKGATSKMGLNNQKVLWWMRLTVMFIVTGVLMWGIGFGMGVRHQPPPMQAVEQFIQEVCGDGLDRD